MLLSVAVNLSTIVVAVVIAAIFVAIVANGIRRRKRGQGGCGCGCSQCPNSGLCHGGARESTDR